MSKSLEGDNAGTVGEDVFKMTKENSPQKSNVEFLWNASNLSDKHPVDGPAVEITIEMMSKAINKMKAGKAAGP